MKTKALILASVIVLLLVSFLLAFIGSWYIQELKTQVTKDNPGNETGLAGQSQYPEAIGQIPPMETPIQQEALINENTTETINESIALENTTQKNISIGFRLIRKIEIDNAAYSGIISANNKFYVSFESDGSIYVKTYDENFNPIGDRTRMSNPNSMDHAMLFAEGYFYLVDSFSLRKFDSELREIQSTSVISNLPSWLRGNSLSGITDLDDMLFYYNNNTIYLGIGFNDPSFDKEKQKSWVDNIYIQGYSLDLELKKDVVLKDVCVAGGSSMLFENKTFIVICGDKHYDDSSLVAVTYDENFSFIDKRVISAVPNANEEFAMGFLSVDGIYYVSYYHITGDIAKPENTEMLFHTDILLKAFDSGWNLLGETKITDDVPLNVYGHFGTPHLSMVGNKIYVSYESHEAKEAGIKEAGIFVKEYEVIKRV